METVIIRVWRRQEFCRSEAGRGVGWGHCGKGTPLKAQPVHPLAGWFHQHCSKELTRWSSSNDDYDGFASDFLNLHPVLKRAPGVRIQLKSSDRALHSQSIPKHFQGLINVAYALAEMVCAPFGLPMFWPFSLGRESVVAFFQPQKCSYAF